MLTNQKSTHGGNTQKRHGTNSVVNKNIPKNNLVNKNDNQMVRRIESEPNIISHKNQYKNEGKTYNSLIRLKIEFDRNSNMDKELLNDLHDYKPSKLSYFMPYLVEIDESKNKFDTLKTPQNLHPNSILGKSISNQSTSKKDNPNINMRKRMSKVNADRIRQLNESKLRQMVMITIPV